jgi:hypothetical protein
MRYPELNDDSLVFGVDYDVEFKSVPESEGCHLLYERVPLTPEQAELYRIHLPQLARGAEPPHGLGRPVLEPQSQKTD